MTTLIIGFPGTGIRTFHQQADDELVARLLVETEDTSLAATVATAFGQCTYGLIPYTKARLDDVLAGTGHTVTVVYPAPECIKEYLQRYKDQGIAQPDIDAVEATIADDLLALREMTTSRVKHIVLGRNEYISDKFALPQDDEADDINYALEP